MGGNGSPPAQSSRIKGIVERTIKRPNTVAPAMIQGAMQKVRNPSLVESIKATGAFRHATEFCLISRAKNNVYHNFYQPIGQQ
jgi:hypothetical protein